MITIIPARFLGENKWVHIRELNGKDEQSVAGIQSIDAIGLLDRIIYKHPGNDVALASSASLPIADRDRVLMAVYMNTFGRKIGTTVTCSSCHNKFDISFSIAEWGEEMLDVKPGQLNGQLLEFPFITSGNIPFRLPTGEDELAVMGLDPASAKAVLMKRCIPENIGEFDTVILEQAMRETAPLAEIEFEASCPECSRSQWLRFNLQNYLLTSLMNEQLKLVSEVHILASSYAWSLTEILELPRTIRRSYLTLAGSP